MDADKRKYSWWWDSHISPKNSKWLKENLTDMDAKVKQMIQLIEEDADSFARRAEMYYKKRPELMKLVEEFYRAYRALAERYDNATGIIHQANKTMAEAFPNQVPFIFGDDSPSSSSITNADPLTPEMSTPVRASFQHDSLQKDALGPPSSSHFHSSKRNGSFTEETDSVTIKKGLKQLNDLFGPGEAVSRAKFADGRVRKGLRFDNGENTNQNGSYDFKAQIPSESARVAEIQTLKNALAKLQAEKETALLQYQQSMERLSNLESEFSQAQEDSRGKTDRATKAENEVQNLKEALAKLETEREANLVQYQNCLAKLSNLENGFSQAQQDAGEFNKRATKAETEAQLLKQNLATAEAEKEAAIVQYKQCLEMISNLEENLQHAVENAKRFEDQAEKAEPELEALNQTITKLMEEKEAAALLYQQSLETVSCLEHKLAAAEEETKRLNSEIDDSSAKLKGSEERCLLLERSNETFQSELASLVLKLGTQDQELMEKQKELGRLWTCIQEEHLRFVEAEIAFQTLQHLHSQSQEELRSIGSELQTRTQILKEIEAHNQSLEDEVMNVKEENKGLNELNLSSAASIANLEGEVLSLKEKIHKLEVEVELRVDQRNALQQEIYCLKEELNDFIKKHQAVMEQVESVGFNPECFGSSVKQLQDENSKLKKDSERDGIEKIALLERLDAMNKLIGKNAILENSLSDLSVELEAVRRKVKELEESHHSLMGEKSTLLTEKETLISQLQVATETLEKLSEKNNYLEDSLFDVNAEIEGLRVKFNSLGDSYVLLHDEKSNLITERVGLVSQLEISRKRLEDLEKSCEQLQEEYSVLKKERESTLEKMEELKVALDVERQEHVSFVKQSGTELANMKLQIYNLQQEGECRKKDYEEEQERAVNTQFDILILQKCVQDLEENNFSISADCQKLLESSNLSAKLISELEHEKLINKVEVKSLFDQITILRIGLHQLFKALEIESDRECKDSVAQDQMLLDFIRAKLEEMQNSLLKSQDENQKLVTENSVLAKLLAQLKLEAESLAVERNNIDQEFRKRSDQCLLLQSETEKLVLMNEELRSNVLEADQREENSKTEIENLHGQVLQLEGAYRKLQEEIRKVLDEKKSLTKKVINLQEDKCKLEEQNCVLFSESLSQSNLCLIFKDVIAQTSSELLEAEKLLGEIQNERSELNETVDVLKCKYNEVKVIREDQDMQVLKLCADFENQCKETSAIREAHQKLEAELLKLHEGLKETKCREDILIRELQEGRKKIQMWEFQTVALFGELQFSSVHEALFEGKARELAKVCEYLNDGISARGRENDQLKERADTLENENKELKAQLAAYILAVIPLRDCVTSLENHIHLQNEHDKPMDEESKDSNLVNCLHENFQPLSENLLSTTTERFSELHNLQTRILAIEKAVMEMEKLAMLENLNANSKREEAVRQLEELKSQSNSCKESLRKRDHLNPKQGLEVGCGLEPGKPEREICEEGNEMITKDIMLDQISECSSYGISSRRTMDVDDLMLDSWETTGQDGNFDLKLGKAQKFAAPSVDYRETECRSKNPSIISLVEKDLRVDRLELSHRFTEPRQLVNRRNVLNRLDSDAQKLTNLQITIQDLKPKVEIIEKAKRGKWIEYDTTKEQLEETEEAIAKLFDVNRKLIAKAGNGSLCFDCSGSISFDGKSSEQLDSNDNVRQQKISDQAQRASEKIARLQLEVQQLQFQLLKLDNENKRKDKVRITDRKTKVLLQDFLYGKKRASSQKKKKKNFCACVRPPTRGDSDNSQ